MPDTNDEHGARYDDGAGLPMLQRRQAEGDGSDSVAEADRSTQSSSAQPAATTATLAHDFADLAGGGGAGRDETLLYDLQAPLQEFQPEPQHDDTNSPPNNAGKGKGKSKGPPGQSAAITHDRQRRWAKETTSSAHSMIGRTSARTQTLIRYATKPQGSLLNRIQGVLSALGG